MEIEKLLTLSQFVDLIQSQIQPVQYESEDYSCAWAIDRIWYYNNFLKQPLTKEMFVNSIVKPNIKDSLLICAYIDWFYYFEEAENKVIFEGWNKSTHNKFVVISGVNEINFSNADFIIYHKCDKDTYHTAKTISDLAEATSGELTLKNVTI